MDALLSSFGLSVIAVVVLLSLAIPIPTIFAMIPHVELFLGFCGRGVLAVCVSLIVMRGGQNPWHIEEGPRGAT